LYKGGVITGKVTDSSGQPLVKAKVAVHRVRNGDGSRLRVQQDWGDVETDDRGMYRAYGLAEGSYTVLLDQIDQYEDDGARDQAPTYYPSSTVDTAVEVTVRRGDEVGGIDIIHRGLRGHAVSGKCSGGKSKVPSSELYVTLVRTKDGVIHSSRWDGYAKSGAFSFFGVPDGDYYVVAQDDRDDPGAASSPVRIRVAGRDVIGLDLRLVPFGSIEGRLVIESLPRSANTGPCAPKRQLTAQEIVVRISRESDGVDDLNAALFGDIGTSVTDENGNIVLGNLAPGRYRVSLDLVAEDLYVRSITMGGRYPKQRNQAGVFAIKSGERIKGLVFTVANGAAGLRGRAAGLNQTPNLSMGVQVHLVPAEPDRANDEMRYHQTGLNENGDFIFKNIPPGRYWLLRRSTKAESQSVAPEAISRAALRRESVTANNSIQLQPCQSTTDYFLR
jgi:hypothetical protein